MFAIYYYIFRSSSKIQLNTQFTPTESTKNIVDYFIIPFFLEVHFSTKYISSNS